MEFPRLLSGVLALALLASACGDDTVSAVAASEQEPAAAVASEEPTATPAPAASEPPPATATPAPTPAPEPTTTPAPEVEDAAAAVVPAECIRLTDFDDADGWRIVNDGVMGGLSDGRASVADGVLVFEGTIVTDGGGFSMVRAGLVAGALDGVSTLRFRLRPDDRRYELIADDAQQGGRSSISHFGALVVQGSDWQEVDVPLDQLAARSFGTPVDVEPFRPDLAVSIGIILADGADGPFSLQVDWIDACR